MKKTFTLVILLLLPLQWLLSKQGRIDDIGTRVGQAAVRMALPDFRSTAAGVEAAQLTAVFNEVLKNDLAFSGSIQLISPSFYPLGTFANPADIQFAAWRDPQVNAEFIAFGSTVLTGNRFSLEARLWDLKLEQNPEMLANRYTADEDTEDSVRMVAHRLADDIIERLGFGKGIARTKIVFSSDRGDGLNKEIFVMDYDGHNAQAITNLKSSALLPALSPDGDKIAFTLLGRSGWDIAIFSRLDRRPFRFPDQDGLNFTTSWSPDGTRLAYASSKNDNDGTEIFVADWTGANMRRLTVSRGADFAPVWNPKTGSEIIFASDRSGTPQLYQMSADGTNVRRLIDEGGSAVNPAWSPDGLTLAFAWQKPKSNYDIYLLNLATGKTQQLTTDPDNDERPAWAPDGKHLAFESDRSGTKQIYAMLADGTNVRQLTRSGRKNEGPNWSGYLQ